MQTALERTSFVDSELLVYEVDSILMQPALKRTSFVDSELLVYLQYNSLKSNCIGKKEIIRNSQMNLRIFFEEE
jgi:hypothetical protein